MLDLSYRPLSVHVQHPISSRIFVKDCKTMIKRPTEATSNLDKTVATTTTSTTATVSATSATLLSTTNPSRVVVASAGKLDRLLEKLANAARREFDHDQQQIKSEATATQLNDCARLAVTSNRDQNIEREHEEAMINSLECTTVTTNQKLTHRSIKLESVVKVEVEKKEKEKDEDKEEKEKEKDEEEEEEEGENYQPQSAPFTLSSLNSSFSSFLQTDKQSASTSNFIATQMNAAAAAAAGLNAASSTATSCTATTTSSERKSLNSSSASNFLQYNLEQDMKLSETQTIQQFMLAMLNMSQKNIAKTKRKSELTIVGGGDVLDTDEDESDALPDLKTKLLTTFNTSAAGAVQMRGRATSVHDSINEECATICNTGSNSSAHNSNASNNDDANHALAQRRRSIPHSTSTVNVHDRRHETTNSSHDPNEQEQQQQQQQQHQHQQQQKQQQQQLQQQQQHQQAQYKLNPPQQCESSTLIRPPQVATDDEQVVPKFSHNLPFDLNGRRNKTSNLNNSSSTISSQTNFSNISSLNTSTAMRATTPNSTFNIPGTMDSSLITSYLLSQAQFNHGQSALLSLTQQYQILGSLASKRARLEESSVEENGTTNDLAAKLLNQLLYAQRPITTSTSHPNHHPNHNHVDSPLDLSVKTPSPQPAGSPRSLSPIDPLLLARFQQQQLIASHQAFKRRSSGSSTFSEFSNSLPSTPTTPASLLSQQQVLHGTIFDPSLIFSDQTQLKIDTRIDSTRRSRKNQNVKNSQKQVSPSQSPRSELSSDSPSTVGECHACHLCGQTFAFYDRLAKHIASRHKVKTSPTQGLDTSGRAYNCDICNRSFARSDMLTRHMRLHTGIKPYTCGVCQQVFSRSDHLSTHQRTHTGEKPYKCPQCPYAACRRDMITRHMKTHSRYEMPDSSSSAASPLAASPIH